MNRLGMVINVSHASDAATSAAIDASAGPIVATHHGLRSNVNIQRNMPEWLLKKMAAKGGVFGLQIGNEFHSAKEYAYQTEHEKKTFFDTSTVRQEVAELTIEQVDKVVALQFPRVGPHSASCENRTVTSDKRFISTSFPRSSQYHPEWVLASVSGGANSLWLTEWLTSAVDLRPGMRVLDLGCGRAASSIFLRREFGVQVWATDLWFSVSENIQRIRDAGVEDGVFPIHADARSLPFATDFFDAVVCIDSFCYYGTDDLYLNYLAGFVKSGGQIGIAGAGLVQEIEGPLPEHLCRWWTPELSSLHSASWWRRHWERTGIMDIDVADTMPDGWQRWLDWHRAIAPDNELEISALEADRGSFLGYVRLAGRRRGQTDLADHIVSVPAQYTKKPLLRVED